MIKWAVFSPCQTYRYLLVRRWQPGLPLVVFIGLNPSTADDVCNDPTIRRCMSFARSWGYGGVGMINLFAFRATQPSDMKRAVDPVGPANDAWIRCVTHDAYVVVAAWGTQGGFRARCCEVAGWVENLYCLGLTKAGYPRHPLFVRRDCTLLRYML